jgi:hypothetical protein
MFAETTTQMPEWRQTFGFDGIGYDAATPVTYNIAVNGGTFIGPLDFSINFRQFALPLLHPLSSPPSIESRVRRFRIKNFFASKRNDAKRDPFRIVFACSCENNE